MIIRQICIQNDNVMGFDQSQGPDIYPGYQVADGCQGYNVFRSKHQQQHRSYKEFAQQLIKNFDTSLVLQLGSGAGNLSYWIRQFNKNCKAYVSIDINRLAARSPYYKGNSSHHYIGFTDKPYHFVDQDNQTLKFTTIFCFEHYQHITPHNFSLFLQNIKRHMTKDTIIVSSAACTDRGYGGKLHCNRKSQRQWRSFFQDNGFEFLNKKILNDKIRPYNIDVNAGNQFQFIFKLKSCA